MWAEGVGEKVMENRGEDVDRQVSPPRPRMVLGKKKIRRLSAKQVRGGRAEEGKTRQGRGRTADQAYVDCEPKGF